jgi:tRNA-Thr(GGU) m(6)t(6)A37 methyltransferase TsaA
MSTEYQPLFSMRAIGLVRSVLTDRVEAPKQSHEGAPEARLEIDPAFVEGLEGLTAGTEIWILTWLHQSDRTVFRVHPRDDARNPLVGVFATRSSDRPNPIGLHRARVLFKTGNLLGVDSLEAIDLTPIIDIKPVIESDTTNR